LRCCSGWPRTRARTSQWRRGVCAGSRSGTPWADGGFELILVNAAQIKNVPGGKTDVKDADWISESVASSLIRASFVPGDLTQDVRPFPRTRKQFGPRRRATSCGSKRPSRLPTSNWAGEHRYYRLEWSLIIRLAASNVAAHDLVIVGPACPPHHD
jgi:hypothetical protein